MKQIREMDEQLISQLKSALESFQCRSTDEHYAVATNLIDIRNFYIVPLDCYKLMYILEKPGKPCQTISKNSVVIYESPTLKSFVRGKVQRLEGSSNIIFAMDYGITDMNVKPDAIFIPEHEEASSIPELAQLCELSRCYPRSGDVFSDEDTEAFKFFMGLQREKLRITIKEKVDTKMGVLVISSQSNPDCVSTALAYCNQTAYFGRHL